MRKSCTYNVLLALSVTIVSSILTYVSRDMLLLLINAWGILSFSVVVLELKFANESEKMQKRTKIRHYFSIGFVCLVAFEVFALVLAEILTD